MFRYAHPNEDHHIGGSDASGIVWKVGEGVTRWKPGDEVVIHCNQASYEDPEVHGLDPLAAPSQQIWGYETSWGSFAQFCKVQAQQLLHKPKHLAWEEAAAYGLTYFTAYRMLIDRCKLQPGNRVLIWGAAGGLGVFATQLCALTGADAVGVVSSQEKGELIEQLGAVGYIDRSEFAGMMRRGGETADEERARFKESRRFCKAVEKMLGGPPDIVFEHVGKATFPTSVLCVKPFGKVVICGATSGYNLDFDVRYLWMRQKEIIGSHFANAWEATKANELIEESKIRPVLWQTMGFEKVAEAHQLLRDNKHLGQDRDPRRRDRGGPGPHRGGPRRDPRRGRRRPLRHDGRRRLDPLVRDAVPQESFAAEVAKRRPDRAALRRHALRGPRLAGRSLQDHPDDLVRVQGRLVPLLGRAGDDRVPPPQRGPLPDPRRLQLGTTRSPPASSVPRCRWPRSPTAADRSARTLWRSRRLGDPQRQLEPEPLVGIVERAAEQLAQPCQAVAGGLRVDPQPLGHLPEPPLLGQPHPQRLGQPGLASPAAARAAVRAGRSASSPASRGSLRSSSSPARSRATDRAGAPPLRLERRRAHARS